MKALTIKQPWASLIVYGYKKYEFRSWKTSYKGKILIHAGAGIDKDAMNKYKHLNIPFPSKMIIGSVDLEECILLDDKTNEMIAKENEFIYGNKKRDGYAWKLSNPSLINYNKTINGKLSLWNVSIPSSVKIHNF